MKGNAARRPELPGAESSPSREDSEEQETPTVGHYGNKPSRVLVGRAQQFYANSHLLTLKIPLFIIGSLDEYCNSDSLRDCFCSSCGNEP